jgi:hypothetical protein
LDENLFNSPQTENPAPEVRGGAELSSEKTEHEFVSLNNAPDLKIKQTFTLVLPNLIHKARSIFPKPKRKKKGI